MHLDDRQLAEYEEQGYLFFPGLLDRAEVAALQQAMPEILDRPGPEVIREKDDSTAARLAFGAHHVFGALQAVVTASTAG